MSANNNHNAAPMGCLNEHLNYFSENIASSQTMLDGDFDDIFTKEFDLVFDPSFAMVNSEAATVARPYHPPPEHPHHHHHQAKPQPVPALVPSAPVVAQHRPNPVVAHSHSAAAFAPPATPATAPKPVMKTIGHMIAPAQVSPTSVTAVFDSIPTPAVPKSSPRKRSYSMVKSTPKPAPVPSSEPVDTSNLSFQEQEDLRRERNRHHAKRSRQRKRDYMNNLEEAVNEMRKENERLFDLLGLDSRQAKADMARDEERKSEVATQKFIAGLKQPRNRVLDNTTLAFLRELWK